MTLRIVVRSLLRSPWYAATSIGTVALTIALAATVFAIVDGVLFKPLPFPEPGRLFHLQGTDSPDKTGNALFAARDIWYLSEADRRIQVAAAGVTSGFINPDRPDLAFDVQGIDPAFFDVLGQHPMVGGFTADDYAAARVPSVPRPALVTYAFWKRWLGGDRSVLGRTVAFGSAAFVVRGILPRDYVHPSAFAGPQVLVPLVFAPEVETDRWRRSIVGIVRLREGITRQEAEARLDAALVSRAGEYNPNTNNVRPGPYVAVRMRSLAVELGRGQRRLFRAAFAVAALLVLLGAINTASLFGARAQDRERELAVRAALGGGRTHLVRVLLAEASLVAVIGGAAGMLLAYWLLEPALLLFPESFASTLLNTPEIDLRVVTFALFAAIVPGVMCAVIPAIGVTRAVPARRLSGAHTTTTRERGWGRDALLLVQSALGIVLVVLGGLLVASFVIVRGEDPGFDRRQLALVELLIPVPSQREAGHARAFERMANTFGAGRVAALEGSLLRSMYAGSMFTVPEGGETFFASDVPVSDRFFEIAGLELLEGRYPTQTELAGIQRVAAVSVDTAAAYWPGRSAVGQILVSQEHGPFTVVGVIEGVRFGAQDDPLGGEIYIPRGLRRAPLITYLIKTAGDPARDVRNLALQLRRELPGVLVRRAESLDQALANSVKDRRATMVMFTLTGVSGLLLLGVGIVGLVAGGVARRRREIGIRTTLGAQPSQVTRLFVAQYLRPVAIGALSGVFAAWWAALLVEAFIYGIDVHEPMVFAAAVATLLAAAALAAWLPARRASAIDPLSVLRTE